MTRDRRSRIEDEAGRWLVRMREGPSEADRRAFIAWYNQHEEHRCTYDRLGRFWDDAPRTGLTSPLADPFPPRRAPSRHLTYAMAALVAACAIGAAMLAGNQRLSPVSAQPQELLMLATEVGEIRTETVADGLKVTLDTDSAVAVSGDRRRLRLERGRARIGVDRRAAPIVVDAGAARIDAEQAVFDVRVEAGEAVVTPVEGAVAVASVGRDGEAVRVSAQQSLAVAPGAVRMRDGPDRSRSWPRGLLEFDGAALRAVVDEANRYSPVRIRLADPDLGSLRVTGQFRVGDTAGLGQSLAAAFGLSLSKQSNGDLLLHPPSQKSSGGGGG